MSLVKYCFTLFRRNFISDGAPSVVNFGERTLTWIKDSTHSHIMNHGDKYPFKRDDVKLLTNTQDTKTLIPCSEQLTSQWFINRMISSKYHIHSFTKISGNFDLLKNQFKLSENTMIEPANEEENDLELLYDKDNKIKIEKAETNELGINWIKKHKYDEYFDIILDELAMDNIITMDIDNYVSTTIYGHALKQTGILYVVDRKIPGDIAGAQLRKKIWNLYPNTHFELIAERDTPWTTQFVFLKVHSCEDIETDRDIDRKDHVGDTHYEYSYKRGRDNSEILKSAGVDMREGMDRVQDALGMKRDKDSGPKF